MTWFRDLGVRIRLPAALAVMFALMLLVSVIGLRVLDRTEVWMNVLHRDTLIEVAAEMDLSRDASDLATSAPFLFALHQLTAIAPKRESKRTCCGHGAVSPLVGFGATSLAAEAV